MDEEQVGPATKLAQEVGQGLQKLQQLLAASGGSDEEVAQMDQIMGLYVDLVEKKLGGGEAEEPAPEPMPNQVPQSQGIGGQPVGPQVRN